MGERLWRWLTRDRWVIWLCSSTSRCAYSTHRTWAHAHHRVHQLERVNRWRHPPVWYEIEPITKPIPHGLYCVDRD